MIEMQTNVSEVIAGLDRIVPAIRDSISEKVRDTVTYIDTKVHERTPVWSGRAVRNMIWTMDQPNEFEFHPVAEPEEPGATSSMALGSEPRRAANEAAARETFRALTFADPFHAYILTNNATNIGLIEDGEAPTADRSRSPAGVFAITAAEVLTRLNSGAAL